MVSLQRRSNKKDGTSLKTVVLSFMAGAVVATVICSHLCGLTTSTSWLMINGDDVPVTTKTTGSRQQGERFTTTTTEPSFFDLAKKTGTDKVLGAVAMGNCDKKPDACRRYPNAANPKCRVWGHFYHTFYNRWLQPYTKENYNDRRPFSFLEVGFYNGKGYQAYEEFLSNKAQLHSIEISCSRKDGKNFAGQSARYQELLDTKRLHCGDAGKYEFLHDLWTNHLKSDNVPLEVVVDDASHLSKHMAMSVFFWFPRIAPGGLLIIEDIQPQDDMNTFRMNLLPKLLQDLHYCGGGVPRNFQKEALCFPTIQPLLQSIHCEMHICVLERNNAPSTGDSLTREESLPPKHALDTSECPIFSR